MYQSIIKAKIDKLGSKDNIKSNKRLDEDTYIRLTT